MPRRRKLIKMVAFAAMLFVVVQTGACGFILYPERKGRTNGRIDPGVAILDAILLLPGILPGVIAFAVDFVTGCIYISYNQADIDTLKPGGDPDTMTTASSSLDVKALERILSEYAGKPVHIDASQVTVLRINDPDFIAGKFVRLDGKLSWDVLVASGQLPNGPDDVVRIR
jgi:hypothetical protein